ncbi:MAG: protoglobin domain-containing protein, partial [Kangiellaceae bacterium]
MNMNDSTQDQAHAISISSSERERRLKFVRFTAKDAKLLAEMLDTVSPKANAIVDDFYDNLSQYPELLDIINQAGSSVERLKASQRHYLLDLFGGEYGENYFMRRLKIGTVHTRIGLGPQWYLGSYAGYTRQIIPLITKKYRFRPKKMDDTIGALNKIIFIDAQLVMDSYESVTKQLDKAMVSYTKFVDEVTGGNLTNKVEIPSNPDLARLGIRLNQMTESLAEITNRNEEASNGLAVTVN